MTFLNKYSESCRASHQRLSSSGHLVAMNVLLLVTSILVLGSVSGQKCAKDKINTAKEKKLFYKWTEMQGNKPVKDAQCWFDLTR